MILLRRGRPVSPSGSSFDFGVTMDLDTAFRRQRQECFAPWRPPIEAFETEGELVVRAEIGGLTQREIEVLVADDQLVIRGERNVVRPVEHRLYHESHVRYGPFEASVRLPFPIDVELATADYLDGFLTVTLPRLAPTHVPMRGSPVVERAQRGGQ